VLTTLGYGVMRPTMRTQTNVTWGPREERGFAALTTALRFSYKLLARRAVLSPLGYNRWRYEQLIEKYKSVGLTSFAAPN
jgi:hypothetical protein